MTTLQHAQMLIKNARYTEAYQALEELDDPAAQDLRKQVNRQQLKIAHKLLGNKQYDEARTLLTTIDHPQARAWLEKLDAMPRTRPPQPQVDDNLTEPDPRPENAADDIDIDALLMDALAAAEAEKALKGADIVSHVATEDDIHRAIETQDTTEKQFEQAQIALQAKNYSRAREILTSLDTPEANERLAKLDSIELKKFRKAGELNKAGKKDHAIALLQTISHPKAAQTLKKLGVEPAEGELPSGTTYEWITDNHKFGFVMEDNTGVYSIHRRNDNLDVDDIYLEIYSTDGKRIKGRKFYGENYHDFVGEYVSPNELHIQIPGLKTGRLWWKSEVSYRFRKIDLDVRLYHPRISAVLLAVCWAIAFLILPENFTGVELLPFLEETRAVLEVRRAVGLFLFVLPLMYMRTMIPLIRRCWRVVLWRFVSLTIFILLIPIIIAALAYFVMALVLISIIGVFFKIMDWDEVDRGTGYENGQHVRYYSMEQGCMSVLTGYLAQLAWFIAGGLGLLLLNGILNLTPSLFPQRVSVND